jgi:hypothetical protein
MDGGLIGYSEECCSAFAEGATVAEAGVSNALVLKGHGLSVALADAVRL